MMVKLKQVLVQACSLDLKRGEASRFEVLGCVSDGYDVDFASVTLEVILGPRSETLNQNTSHWTRRLARKRGQKKKV